MGKKLYMQAGGGNHVLKSAMILFRMDDVPAEVRPTAEALWAERSYSTLAGILRDHQVQHLMVDDTKTYLYTTQGYIWVERAINTQLLHVDGE